MARQVDDQVDEADCMNADVVVTSIRLSHDDDDDDLPADTCKRSLSSIRQDALPSVYLGLFISFRRSRCHRLVGLGK